MAKLEQTFSAPVFGSAIDLARSPNRVISEIYSTGSVRDKEGKQISGLIKSGIPFDEGMALYSCIRQFEPKRTLEIGMAYGLSTLFMCQAHYDNGKDGRHVAIDPKQTKEYKSIGLLNIKRANLDGQLEFIEAPSYLGLPKLVDEGRRFELIFIDGMHTFDYTLVDFFYSDLLLKAGGYLIFDDIWMPSVRKVILYVQRNRSYRLVPKLLWNPGSPLKHSWSFFMQRGRRQKIGLNAKQFLQNPFDLSTFFKLAYFSIKGSPKYFGLQKVAEDYRQWHYHVAF